MPIISRIPQDHPDRAEILRLLESLGVAETETLTIAQRQGGVAVLNDRAGWEVTLATREAIAVCFVRVEDGPTGILLAASKLLSEARR
jgi:hypothetical protein